MSGGVVGAPFAAGVLVGWTQSGNRPTFDVVTGISSGALIGAYAFLGPKYDARLKQVILSLKTSDLVKYRRLTGPLCLGAFGSAKPAERFIRREVNACFLADLRQAHAEGRRFFVGTMDLHTKQLVVWDVGALAASGRPDAGDLVRKVLLAAIAWPGLVPPVEFDVEVNGRCYHEQHFDGGTAALAFLRFGPQPHWPRPGAAVRPGWLAGSNLYVLGCRKLYSDPAPAPKRAVPRVMAALDGLLEALGRADIARLHTFCGVSGMRFHLLAVPPEYHGAPPGAWGLYPKDAPLLFDLGFQAGTRGPAWRLTPPGAEPGEEAIPRGPCCEERASLLK
jgi:hypothetical protein